MLSLAVLLMWFYPLRTAEAASSGIPMDRYSSSSQTSQTSTSDTYLEGKEDIDQERFNGEVLDTIIFFLGGIAGFAMILHVAAFSVVRIFPSTNRVFEKLKFLGIDGYDDGLIIPIIKILLLGVLSFLCISGYMKRLVGFIFGLFTVATS